MRFSEIRAVAYCAAALVIVLAAITAERALAVAGVPNATKTTYVVPVREVMWFTLASKNLPVQVSIAGTGNYRGNAFLLMSHVSDGGINSLAWTGTSTIAMDGSSLTGSFLNGYLAQGPGSWSIGYVAYLVRLDVEMPDLRLRLYNSNDDGPAKIVVTQIW